MKIKIPLILFFGLFFGKLCFSQSLDTLFSKAKFYYENEEYDLAIPWLTRYIAINPVYYKSYLLRGNCYVETGSNSLAINDYKHALLLKNDPELLYNLGGAYEKSEKTDSAIYFFKKFVDAEPDRTEGYTRLAIIYLYQLPLLADSAIFYASRAVKIRQNDLVNLNLLAMSYYAGNRFDDALKTSRAGLEIDSSSSLLNRTAGISSFFLKDYASSVTFFDRAFRHKTEDYTLLDYKIQSMLLNNTRPEILTFETGQRPSFKEISYPTAKKAIKKTVKSEDPNYYESLLARFNTSPQNMSLDEYIILYLGYQNQNLTFADNKNQNAGENSPVIEVQNLENILRKNPTDFPRYLELARIYRKYGNKQDYFQNMFKYLGFLESIKASGNGKDPSTAFLVTDISHEFALAQSLGCVVKERKQVKLKGHIFDVLTVNDATDKENSLYFSLFRNSKSR